MEKSVEEDLSETPGKQGACFLSQERICGPDCMAFLTKPPEGPAFTGEQWAHCHLLVNADRTGRHLVVLADVGSKIIAVVRDQQRKEKAPGI